MYVIGTAGHVDHGKSTLVEALTGIDPDRLLEEKERGMTIDLGFAWLPLPSGNEVSVVDVPGHERFVKNMLAGVGGIDLALLVVAADESVMPQTREHLAILDLLQIKRGLVAISKMDLVEKVNPYLRPLYDSLHDMVDYERVARFIDRGIIEVAPLAFMRGRTLSEAFVILDAAQNTTSPQMKMFLTRLGVGSKAVITGDPSQIDLPRGQRSGLDHAAQVLACIPDILMIRFTADDVVRHGLVSRIIRAYDQAGRSQSWSPARRPRGGEE